MRVERVVRGRGSSHLHRSHPAKRSHAYPRHLTYSHNYLLTYLLTFIAVAQPSEVTRTLAIEVESSRRPTDSHGSQPLTR